MPQKLHTYTAIPLRIELKQEGPELNSEVVNEILDLGPVCLQVYASLNLHPGELFLLFYPIYSSLEYSIQTSTGTLKQQGELLQFISNNGIYIFKIIGSYSSEKSALN